MSFPRRFFAPFTRLTHKPCTFRPSSSLYNASKSSRESILRNTAPLLHRFGFDCDECGDREARVCGGRGERGERAEGTRSEARGAVSAAEWDFRPETETRASVLPPHTRGDVCRASYSRSQGEPHRLPNEKPTGKDERLIDDGG
ncbi:hypothetical protein NL108_016249 [Boleophthalmus pectinirostris]|nr:hypothetical protein NL108_016249 [Boleophthalmus pectinirostris]